MRRRTLRLITGVIRVERHVSHCSRFNRPAKWLHVKITVWRGKTRCVAEIPALSTRVEAAGMVQLCDKVADALEPLAVKHLQDFTERNLLQHPMDRRGNSSKDAGVIDWEALMR